MRRLLLLVVVVPPALLVAVGSSAAAVRLVGGVPVGFAWLVFALVVVRLLLRSSSASAAGAGPVEGSDRYSSRGGLL